MKQSDFDELWMAVPGGYIPSVASSMKPQMTIEQGIELQRRGEMWFSQQYGCWLVKRTHDVLESVNLSAPRPDSWGD
jgi:hypothetical protein